MLRWLAVLVVAPLFLAACGGAELEPVQTVRSGAYELELRAREGVLRKGDNRVAVHVNHEGEPVAVQGGRLSFMMQAMGAMPRMDTATDLAVREGRLEGTIRFEMSGEWNGQVEVTTPDGPVQGTLRVQVR